MLVLPFLLALIVIAVVFTVVVNRPVRHVHNPDLDFTIHPTKAYSRGLRVHLSQLGEVHVTPDQPVPVLWDALDGRR
jgi:hypothetical protein